MQPGLAQGYLNFVQNEQMRKYNALVMQRMAEENAMRQRQQAARGPAFEQLATALGGQQQMPPPAPQPGSLSPGGGNPMAPGGGSIMAPPAAPSQPPPAMQQTALKQIPPPIPPFKALPQQAPPSVAARPGQVPPPPAAPAPAGPGVVEPKPLDLKNIVAGLKASGVPSDKAMDMLDQLAPIMNAQNKQELEYFKANNAALKAANDAYAKTMQAMAAQTRAQTGITAEERRKIQGDERNSIARARLGRQAGGEGNITRWETDNAGNVVGGWTKTGKHIKVDEPGTLKKEKGPGAQAAVRQNIVKSGITNSIARLNEIEKAHPGGTTSVFFGQSGQNPITRGVYGAGKATQSKTQQDVDAKWASMIDEAIPVFTGGLRGSDAFRRFLIEQAPGPGDKPETVKEKMRLFRQNIEGTSRAFFNKYSADPSFWGPGVTAEEVKGGGAAAQQGEWKVEKVEEE